MLESMTIGSMGSISINTTLLYPQTLTNSLYHNLKYHGEIEDAAYPPLNSHPCLNFRNSRNPAEAFTRLAAFIPRLLVLHRDLNGLRCCSKGVLRMVVPWAVVKDSPAILLQPPGLSHQLPIAATYLANRTANVDGNPDISENDYVFIA